MCCNDFTYLTALEISRDADDLRYQSEIEQQYLPRPAVVALLFDRLIAMWGAVVGRHERRSHMLRNSGQRDCTDDGQVSLLLPIEHNP